MTLRDGRIDDIKKSAHALGHEASAPSVNAVARLVFDLALCVEEHERRLDMLEARTFAVQAPAQAASPFAGIITDLQLVTRPVSKKETMLLYRVKQGGDCGHLHPDTPGVCTLPKGHELAHEYVKPAPSPPPPLPNETLEDKIESAFWRFDALHKANYRDADPSLPGPMSERDAFKAAVRRLVVEVASLTCAERGL